MFEFEPKSLFKNRLLKHLKELNRYLRYMFNGHMAFALFFFIVAFAYFYQGWLRTLPDNFPTALVIGIIFGVIASYSPVQTFLKEPDLVFIIPVEEKMYAYFRRAITYSYIIHIYIVLLFSAALGPLYFATYDDRVGQAYFGVVIALFIFKLWNFLMNWWMSKIRNTSVRTEEFVLRIILNISVFALLIHGNIMIASILTIIFVSLFIYIYTKNRDDGVNWELLLEKDRERMHSFYRIASLFTEIPHLKSKVRRRSLLTRLFGVKKFGKAESYRYLYTLVFLRSGDYFSMFVRLVIIGSIAIYLMPHILLKLGFALLFLYITSLQLMTLYRHHRTVMWIDIYPIEADARIQAVVELLHKLGMIQLLIFSLMFIIQGQWLGLLLVIVIGLIFNTLFISVYAKNKYKKEAANI